jgi:hypothetical protein
MQQKKFRFGPVALANAAANILNPGTTTGGTNCTAAPYDKLRIILTHIRIVNKTGGAVTFSLYIGATGGSAAGTEFMGTAVSVPANSYVDWYGCLPLDTTDFLSGLASAAASLTIEGEGELGIY